MPRSARRKAGCGRRAGRPQHQAAFLAVFPAAVSSCAARQSGASGALLPQRLMADEASPGSPLSLSGHATAGMLMS
jgi:hypothetical protein